MGRFSKATTDRQTAGGNWWKRGNYRGRITKVEYRNGHKGESYIIEAEVLQSSNPEILPGETRSQVIKLDKESAMGNIGSFVAVCSAILSGEYLDDPEKMPLDESDIEATYAADQPLVGVEVEIEAIDITTKAGKPFTKIVYKVPSELRAAA